MVFIGDLFQLPPVVMEADRDYILKTYGGQYFFDATVFKTYKYHFKELTTIFRQSNERLTRYCQNWGRSAKFELWFSNE